MRSPSITSLNRPFALLALMALLPALLLALDVVRAEPSLALSGADDTSNTIIPLESWNDPPRVARPIARWWWPGGSVDVEAMDAQLAAIARAGFGAVEVQPLLLGLGADDLAADDQLRTVGMPAFRKRVAAAAALATKHGLDVDLTVGSGWPGGLPTTPDRAERQLLMSTFDVEGPIAFGAALPPAPDQSYRRAVEWVLDVLGPPDEATRVVTVLAARLEGERDGTPILTEVRDITANASGSKLEWAVPEGRWRVFVFHTNSTMHFVMGGAFPGAESDALVVDHLSERGADALLEGYVTPVVDAIAAGQLRGVFVDSFELMGELPFSDDFLNVFEVHAGYDLRPHLPLVFRRGGESKYAAMIDVFGTSGEPLYASALPGQAERIREDYEAVRAMLFRERFVGRFVDWARKRGLELRLQAHGGYADYLDTYALADVPESEALFGHGSFDFLKLAASAARISDRRWASSESFITLRLLGTQLEDDEMRLLAGRAYSAGINRIVHHGVPYPYTRADGETWYPFSGGFGRILAGPMPMSSQIDAEALTKVAPLNAMLSRLSVAMSTGKPAASVAWLRAEPLYPDAPSFQIGRIDPHANESTTTRALRARGLSHDRVSRRMLATADIDEGRVKIGARRYRAILLDPMQTAEPELLEAIAAIGEAGTPVIALGALPTRATGLRDAQARDARVSKAVTRIEAIATPAASEASLAKALAERVPAEWAGPAPGTTFEVSLDRRRATEGEIMLVVNESWSPSTSRFVFDRSARILQLWDPATGTRELLRTSVEAGDAIEIELGPAESKILTWSKAPDVGQTHPSPQPARGTGDSGRSTRS